MVSFIKKSREEFHAALRNEILTVDAKGVASNADRGSKISRKIASALLDELGDVSVATKLPGQTSGSSFEEICANFVGRCFEKFEHLRPGEFFVRKGGQIAEFDQYAHLDDLEQLAARHPQMATALGSDYLIKPDIVVGRHPESDDQINRTNLLVDSDTAKLTSLRSVNQSRNILHASISCKWTLRSDRAQNARSEGLNLVRNRKGKLPHICVVIGEPMPSRIASLALGTGDLDCVYHFALPELMRALDKVGGDDRLEQLQTMIDGKRLRDIADLPLDLTV
ncbi:NgoMIV family type II restriction endonuclease [Erythrobacter sp. W53]|uniref:NgoMIV family type II restriction endonuclease n=1 Tax=Erythrobacter sp. W53 TaxID=3425947 RepID=UPI003D7691E6